MEGGGSGLLRGLLGDNGVGVWYWGEVGFIILVGH